MKRLLVSAALVAAIAVPLRAQESVVSGKPSVFHITPYAGYVFFGDHFESSSDVEFSNEDGGIYGAQLGIDFAPNLSLIGNFAYSKTEYTLENFGSGGSTLELSDVGVWFYDANLQFKLPFWRGNAVYAPFAQAGAGAIKFSNDDNDLSSSGPTNFAFNVGLGFDWQMRGIGIRLMAKDYISSFEWDELRDANTTNEIQEASISNNWAITAGLKIGF